VSEGSAGARAGLRRERRTTMNRGLIGTIIGILVIIILVIVILQLT
jgi:tetrahydromethanopterin S-methyltransferase subunit F